MNNLQPQLKSCWKKIIILWCMFLTFLFKLWYLFIILLFTILLPILIFLPREKVQNFDQIVTNFALKILCGIWRVIKVCSLIVFALILFVLSPILWPIYLGIAVLRPRFVIDLLFDTKIF